MKTRFIAAVLLLSISFAVFAQTIPFTATDRVKNLAHEEVTWRWIGGGVKVVAGAILTGFGYSLVTFRDNAYATAVVIPLGIIALIPGVITLGWGGYDLLFGSREYENAYDKLKLSSDAEREDKAILYLKEKAAKDKEGRKPSFWNAFGLLSLFESPAEREYNAYLKERGLSQ